jgi:hypothetical protein
VIPTFFSFPLFGPEEYTVFHGAHQTRSHPQHLPQAQYPVVSIFTLRAGAPRGGRMDEHPAKKNTKHEIRNT